MQDDISNTIEVLTARVRVKEEEANKLKRLVNELCSESGVKIAFPGVLETSPATGPIRSDEYYGQTLTAAIRNYLERRKTAGAGAATVEDIFSAIKEGGYKFESRNDTNAKISVGNALRKTSSIFHRLPNGNYGLLTWYPGAKAKPEEETHVKRKRKSKVSRNQVQSDERKKTGPLLPENSPPDAPKPIGGAVTNGEVREVILSQAGEFQSNNIERLVKAKFPTKELPKPKVPTVIFILKKKGLLKQVAPKSGSKPAIYAKI
jgi:hypothetical protein